MSNSPRSLSQHLAECLERADNLRSARRFGEALVWVNTAACLDGSSEKSDPYSRVNKALFQFVFDIAGGCQNLVMKCGNITTTHGALVAYASEALGLLEARLTPDSADSSFALVQILRSHFAMFTARFARHFAPGGFHSTDPEDARYLRDTTAQIQAALSACAQLSIQNAHTYNERAQLLYAAAASPDYEVHGFPFQFLNDWGRALFFVESAQMVLKSMLDESGLVPVMRKQAVERVAVLLDQALILIKSQDVGLKRLYPELSNLVERLSR